MVDQKSEPFWSVADVTENNRIGLDLFGGIKRAIMFCLSSTEFLSFVPPRKHLVSNRLLITVAAFCLLLTILNLDKRTVRKRLQSSRHPFETDSDQKSYSDIEEELFIPLGFTSRDRGVIASLDYKDKSCPEIFNSFLSGSQPQNESAAPPVKIPPELMKQYLLNGYTHLIEVDQHSGTLQETWKKSDLEPFLSRGLEQIDGYSYEGQAIYKAMLDHSVSGKRGIVVGSRPWVEAIPLSLGAEHITTVEYMKIMIEDLPQLSYLHPVELAKDYEKHVGRHDFVVSFSSIEHSGLGRYGDVLDPFGDLKEAQKIHCMLKEGGLFFAGLPIGWNILHWNLHRIYGRVRLALFTAGFDIVDMYYKDKKESFNVDWFKKPEGDLLKMSRDDYGWHSLWKQPVFVLRKL